MKLFSPAKINLFFRVLSKREDGFHEISSLMQAISLGDTLTFEVSEQDLLTTSDPSLPCDETNFIHQARTLFRNKTGYPHQVRIHLEKRIPLAAGLGGGSGNIATTLWALNQLSGFAIKEEILREWAGEISSDAPFFFSSGTALTSGRGEVVESLTPLKQRSLLLARPKGKGLSTPLVYKHCQPTPFKGNSHYQNDLELPAFKLRPDLAQLKKELLILGFETVVMSGSGTTFFCFGEGDPILASISHHLPKNLLHLFPDGSCGSPLASSKKLPRKGLKTFPSRSSRRLEKTDCIAFHKAGEKSRLQGVEFIKTHFLSRSTEWYPQSTT